MFVKEDVCHDCLGRLIAFMRWGMERSHCQRPRDGRMWKGWMDDWWIDEKKVQKEAAEAVYVSFF